MSKPSEKAPAMQFYVRDYLVDTACLSLAARGAWMHALCHLWLQDIRGTMTLPLMGWVRLFGCSLEEAVAVLNEIAQTGVGEVNVQTGNAEGALHPALHVTLAGVTVTECNTEVTLTCRRMYRLGNAEVTERERTRQRVAEYRLRKQSEASNTAVTADTPAQERSGNAEVTPPSSYASATASADTEIIPPIAPSSDKPATGNAKRQTRATEFPLLLNTPAFHSAWKRWEAYNRQKRKTLPPTTVEAQLNKLLAMGSVEAAVASIEQSIAANWQSLFPPRDDTGGQANRPNRAKPPPSADPAASWLAYARERERPSA